MSDFNFVDRDTEILTPQGWLSITDIADDNYVYVAAVCGEGARLFIEKARVRATTYNVPMYVSKGPYIGDRIVAADNKILVRKPNGLYEYVMVKDYNNLADSYMYVTSTPLYKEEPKTLSVGQKAYIIADIYGDIKQTGISFDIEVFDESHLEDFLEELYGDNVKLVRYKKKIMMRFHRDVTGSDLLDYSHIESRYQASEALEYLFKIANNGYHTNDMFYKIIDRIDLFRTLCGKYVIPDIEDNVLVIDILNTGFDMPKSCLTVEETDEDITLFGINQGAIFR